MPLPPPLPQLAMSWVSMLSSTSAAQVQSLQRALELEHRKRKADESDAHLRIQVGLFYAGPCL